MRVAELGGTLGEQLVATGAVTDEALTDFYRSRLLVPQVNPNTLARLPVRVIAAIPSEMAIELRAVPVSFDAENSLTVAMSDPSDRHAVDEISFFTGAYVVRAVATQMQIAWCLAHYYGHLTQLGHRLIQTATDGVPQSGPTAAPATNGATNGAADDDVPKPRARSISGEIRVPRTRAASIKPPPPETHEDIDDDADEGPVISIEVPDPDEDPTGPTKLPQRKRKAKTDPPELAARAGEVDIATGPVRKVDDEPRIIISDELEEKPALPDTSGELRAVTQRDHGVPMSTIEVDDTSGGVVIHEHPTHDLSEPVLLERRRASDPPIAAAAEDEDVVVLDAPKHAPVRHRTEKRTQVGIGVLPAVTRAHRDTEADATRVDAQAVAPAPEDTTDETIAPPSPRDDTSEIALPPGPAPRASAPAISARGSSDAIPRIVTSDDDDGLITSVMSAVELDEAIPQRSSDVVPAHLAGARAQRVDVDPVDDGWGPPGTTIPPPLLGAIPGSHDDASGVAVIPMPNIDSAPLMIAPPSPPEVSRGTSQAEAITLARALEDATMRTLELIRFLEVAGDRDSVIALMIQHLGDTHRRAGFFSIKSGELALFAMEPSGAALPTATLRLDRPSTLQDVVGTRLPYRGPMHDDASRTYLTTVLGACPPEILLVPVSVRERVVGVLFGEHRQRHTFDDQLALAARAAGMALERILKAKRG